MSTDQYSTRQTLLQKVKSDKTHQAWDEFVNFYTPFIYKVILQIKPSLKDQEDLVQDVLLRLWEKLSMYDTEKGRFRAWLSLVARNCVFNSLKKSRRHDIPATSLDEDSSTEIPVSAQIDQNIEREWKIHICQLAMENITPFFSGEALQVFQLSNDGLCNEEIARKLNLQKDSVKVLKSRVKSRLFKEIQKLINHLEN